MPSKLCAPAGLETLQLSSSGLEKSFWSSQCCWGPLETFLLFLASSLSHSPWCSQRCLLRSAKLLERVVNSALLFQGASLSRLLLPFQSFPIPMSRWAQTGMWLCCVTFLHRFRLLSTPHGLALCPGKQSGLHCISEISYPGASHGFTQDDEMEGETREIWQEAGKQASCVFSRVFPSPDVPLKCRTQIWRAGQLQAILCLVSCDCFPVLLQPWEIGIQPTVISFRFCIMSVKPTYVIGNNLQLMFSQIISFWACHHFVAGTLRIQGPLSLVPGSHQNLWF